MRKKLLVILLLLVVLIVLVVTRCGGKKDQQNDPADGQGFAQQSGKAELPAELKLGVVTETESGAMQLEVEQNGEKTVYVFSDITINDWYVPAVNYVVTNGLMSGTDVGGGLSLFPPELWHDPRAACHDPLSVCRRRAGRCAAPYLRRCVKRRVVL